MKSTTGLFTVHNTGTVRRLAKVAGAKVETILLCGLPGDEVSEESFWSFNYLFPTPQQYHTHYSQYHTAIIRQVPWKKGYMTHRSYRAPIQANRANALSPSQKTVLKVP